MIALSAQPWEQLFPPDTKSGRCSLIPLRLLRKHGDPLLLFPEQRALVPAALSLYPAQTWRAQFFRRALALALRSGIGLRAENCAIAVDTENPWHRFLIQAAGGELGSLAMLLGNPRAPGRRFVLLLFAKSGVPVTLVKVGVGPAATALIAAEWKFLRSQPAERLHAPTVRMDFAAGEMQAFTMEFVRGESPRAEAPIGVLLREWLQVGSSVGFLELSVAAKLEAAAGEDPRWRQAKAMLAPLRFSSAIHHGDFAPWNVRVTSRGEWRVLDWERGEVAGPPAWDWFHWVIQYEVLVRRCDTEGILRRIESELVTPAFREYATAAGIGAAVRPLLSAYLLYCTKVIRQADGLRRIEALLDEFAVNTPTGK